MTSFAQNGLLLDVQHVTMRFGGITAVNDLSMRIPTGSITGLIGPNGAGKTTAFNVISGFYNPQEGDILFKGHSVKGFPPHRICRAGMARTFQNIRLFGSETALENVMVGCQVRRKSQWWMPVFSLPGPYGIGTLGDEAFAFVDFLAAAKQTYWQILPIGPTGYGDSPYQSFSAFAGNPYFIDFRLLAADGLLTEAELPAPQPVGPVDYGALYQQRPVVLHKAADRLLASPTPAYEAFCEAQSGWLEDYALFMAVKAEQGQAGLADWPDDLRTREPAALAAAKERLADEVDYYKAVQFFFYTQWNALKTYANSHGIQLVGDIPIYVSPDSSDLWTHPELFQTDGAVHLTSVAGCPPDAFAADGQLWGNPLYDWPRHEAEDFRWWKQRIKHATSIYDVVRIDHFRGFESYYSIPAGNKTAAGGHWEKGPDRAFIDAIHKALGEGGIIAEDLGYLTPEVKAMLAASGYPGMKIMQFAFDSREPGNYLPYTYPRNSVVYTGTHDNVTAEGWRQSASAEDVAYACRYLRCAPEDLTEAMICACLSCVSDMAVIPLADWLHLDAEARINTPSTQGANWQWRLTQPLTPALSAHIAELTALYHRVPGEEL